MIDGRSSQLQQPITGVRVDRWGPVVVNVCSVRGGVNYDSGTRLQVARTRRVFSAATCS